MKLTVLTLLLLAAGSATAAGVYSWTDPATGKTVYSDQPPPPSIKGQQKNMQGNSIETSGPGYAMKEAMKKAPVVLFVSECGSPCDDARKLLNKRNIPFQLKNPQTQEAYAAELKKLTGALAVPVLQIGPQLIKGYEPTGWNNALDAVGYPPAGATLPTGNKAAAKPADKR